ncbi:hypothetical protein BDQ17DRAFT_1084852 [Cyathus striatus]|nr:hypothetical protein BDQ17DRAFT_1084852 [Cyathus striatus]
MAYVRQNFLPVHPHKTAIDTTVPVRQYSQRHVGDAFRSLSRSTEVPLTPGDPATIGVSLLRNSSGLAELVAFSTPTEIITVSVDSPSSNPLDASFQQLLAGQATLKYQDASGEILEHEMILVGFYMPQIAILLQMAFGVRVRGVDLGALHSPSTLSPWLPGKVISAKVYQAVGSYKVNELWSGNEQGTTTVCLRAWISASSGLVNRVPEIFVMQKRLTRSFSTPRSFSVSVHFA